MKTSRTCERCGTVVPAAAPQNLCPCCLFDTAVDSDDKPPGGDTPAVSRTSRQSDTMGATFGDYELLGELGRGGQGVVYRARHRGLGRIVALKTIPPAHLAGTSAVERFRLEASAASRLDHPNLVPVYEAGERDGFYFYTMKLVEGATIQQLVSAGLPDVAACRHAATVLVKVAQAVHHAHQRGVLHRDLKPSNILLDKEHEPHVSDFGLARYEDEDSSLTVSHALVGTPAYLAPEVAAGGSRQATVAADIYGLGAILYQLLTGRPPFSGATIVETLRSLQDDEAARPGAFNPAVSADLETICLKCLQKEPSKRYVTAQELADDLEHFIQGEPILARPISSTVRLWRWCRRRPLVASLVLGLNLAFALGLTRVLWQWQRAESNARRAEADELSARQHQYVSDMNLVQQAWDDGNFRDAQRLLQAHIPRAGQSDLRGFEWRYLWKLCHDQSRFTFTNFPGPVGLALSPDGKFAGVCSGEFLRLVDFAKGIELDTLVDPGAVHTTVAFSPNGPNIVATGDSDGTIKLWNLATKRLVSSLRAETNSISELAFSPDGRLLASTSASRLSLWDLEGGTNRWTRETALWAHAPLFAPDGRSVLCGGAEVGNPVVYDLAAGKVSAFPFEHKGVLRAAAFSADGRLLATGGSDSTVVLWDYATRTQRGRLAARQGPISALAFSPDARFLLAGSDDSTLRLWDVGSQELVMVLRGHQAKVISVAFTPDGHSLLSGSVDQTLKVWDTEPKPLVAAVPGHRSWANCLFFPDAKRLLSVDFHESVTRVWDVESNRLIATLDGLTPSSCLADFSPDGEWLAIGGRGHTVRLWNAKTLALRRDLTNDIQPGQLSFSPDNRVLAVAAHPYGQRAPKRLNFWDLNSSQKLSKLEAAGTDASAISFAHVGSLVAVGYLDGSVRLWDFQTQTLLKEFKEHRSAVYRLEFSNNSELLGSTSFDEEDPDLILYDVRNRCAFPPLRSHTARLWSVAFAPDGKTVASTSNDGTIKLWNVATRQVALNLRGHIGPVSSAFFSSDGRWMASSGVDATVRLWPAISLNEIPQQEIERK